MGSLFKDRFIKNNLIVLSGSLVISVLSYLYYPVLARMMPLKDFGEVQTLVSIFTQAGLIFGAINILTVVLVASHHEDKRNEHFLRELEKLMVYFLAVLGLVAAILSPWLRDFFRFSSVWPILAVILALLANLPFIFWTSYLQGREQFGGMNLLGIMGASGKLLVPVVLVLAGLGSFGAVFGLFIAQLIALIYVGWRYHLPSLLKFYKTRLPKWDILKLEMRYTVLVFLVTLMTALLYSGDILLVKHYQSPDVAGAYGGIASIARIVFFVTLPFATVLLPSIHSNWEQRLSTLKRSMTFVLILGGSSCFAFWVLSHQLVRLLIGARYEPYAQLLPRLSLAIFMVSIANLLIYYLLSVRSLISLWAAGTGLAIFTALSFVRHGDLSSIVNNLLWANLLTVGMLILAISVWPRLRSSSTLRAMKEVTR